MLFDKAHHSNEAKREDRKSICPDYKVISGDFPVILLTAYGSLWMIIYICYCVCVGCKNVKLSLKIYFRIQILVIKFIWSKKCMQYTYILYFLVYIVEKIHLIIFSCLRCDYGIDRKRKNNEELWIVEDNWPCPVLANNNKECLP